MNIKDFLIDWLEKFVKSRDVMLKSLISIKKTEYGMITKHKHKEHTFFVIPFIDSFKDVINKLKKIGKDKWFSLVIVNNTNNFNIIVKNWKSLVDLGSKFSIYFVNPFSELEKKWIIFPSTHHSIADEASLEKGLKSMFNMVEDINEKRFEGMVQ